jgi:Tol biopolymer transport system component
MYRRIFLKEIREKLNLLIFGVALLLVFAVFYLKYSEEKEFTLVLSEGVILVFLPIFGLLLGSSGFYTEFRDDAWAYLLSRPIKKWAIWLTKYVALLFLLFLIVAFFLLLFNVLPGLKGTLQSYSQWAYPGSYSLFFFILLFSVSAYTVAFSISFLSERQFTILLLAILIGVVEVLFFARYQIFLEATNPYLSRPLGLLVLWPLSFIAASLLTFLHTDFSQARKKVITFLKFCLLFVVLSFVVTSAWIFRGRFLGVKDREYVSNVQSYGGSAYFATVNSIFRFDLGKSKLQRIGQKFVFPDQFSLGGGKIAYFREVYGELEKGKERSFSQELWIMDMDGSNQRCLLDADKKKIAFKDEYFWDCHLSSDGRRVAFASSPWGEGTKCFGVINSDGTGLRSFPLDLPKGEYFVAGWSDSDRSLIVVSIPKRRGPESERRILKFSIEDGTWTTMAEGRLRSIHAGRILSPKGNALAFTRSDDKDSKEILTLCDPATLDKKEIFSARSIDAFQWSSSGAQLVFVADKNKLGVYSLPEDRVIKVKAMILESSYPSFDWVENETKIALTDSEPGGSYLKILGQSLEEEKSVRIPNSRGVNEAFPVQSVGRDILVTDFVRGTVWAFNLDTDKWRKIY